MPLNNDGNGRVSPVMLPKIAPLSRRHQVVHALRQAIAEGRLQAGDRLVEAEIARQMGVSRAPVREALRQLEQEGLVISYPYRGTEVLGVSAQEVEEILVPIRLTLERFAIRHALPALTPEDFDELARWIRVMRDAAEAGDLDLIAEADLRFHELVIERSGQPHCAQIWRTIAPRVRLYFLRTAPAHAPIAEVAEEHEQLLTALQTGDLAKVLPVLEDHILDMVEFWRRRDVSRP